MKRIVNKPKTIADLNINLTFSKTSNYCPLFTDFEIELRNKNPDLTNYRIKPGLYHFRIWIPVREKDHTTIFGGKISEYDDYNFQINVPKPILQGDETYLFAFLYRINYNVYLKIQKDVYYCTELDCFKREYDDFHYNIELGIPF